MFMTRQAAMQQDHHNDAGAGRGQCHRQEGEKLKALPGSLLEKTADNQIQQAIQRAKATQNPDGSFSTAFLATRRSSVDLAENLGSTGHVLEFLVLAMSDEQLNQPWVKRAVARLSKIFELTRSVDLECGKLYHAAHGLALYRDRLYGPRRYREKTSPNQQLN